MPYSDAWTRYIRSKALNGVYFIHKLSELTDDQLLALKDECAALRESEPLDLQKNLQEFLGEIERIQHQRLLD